MKIGALLLGGMVSSRTRRKRKAPRRPLRRGRGLSLFAETARPAETEPEVGGGGGPVSVAVSLPAPVPQPRAEERWLTSADLTRPEGRLRQSIEAFLLDQRSPHTRRSYGKDLKRFVQFLMGRVAGFGPETINRVLIVQYKEYLLADGLEHTSVDRHLSSLRSFFRWLVDDGQLPKNPADGVKFLKPKRLSRTIGFSDEEVQKILQLPDLHTRTGALHYAMLMTLFYCGLRRSELCALRTVNLGEERGQHVLRLRGKGNAERVVVLVPAVWNALRHYFVITVKDPSVDAPIFTPIKNNRTGVKDKPLDPSQVFYVVTRYAKLAGISNRVSPHSCRATAISNARDHKVPDRAIQEFAGWSSTDMITRYDKRKTAVEESAAHAIQYGAQDRAQPEAPEKQEAKIQEGPSPQKFLESLNLTRRR